MPPRTRQGPVPLTAGGPLADPPAVAAKPIVGRRDARRPRAGGPRPGPRCREQRGRRTQRPQIPPRKW
eukprot:2954784-Lingulodinium_polyedra.AAC.1